MAIARPYWSRIFCLARQFQFEFNNHQSRKQLERDHGIEFSTPDLNYIIRKLYRRVSAKIMLCESTLRGAWSKLDQIMLYIE